MHEISLVSNIWRTLKETLTADELDRLNKIKLKIGVLSCVEPKLLDNAYKVLVENTRFRDVKLECRTIKAEAECENCQKPFEVEKFRFICPLCGIASSKILAGEEFLIEGVEFSAQTDISEKNF